MQESNLRITLEDLNDRSIFINWSDEERTLLFSKLLKKMRLTAFARSINYGIPTISDVKNGNVKPSGYVYLNLLKILNIKRNLTDLKISSRNFNSIKIKDHYISPELIGLIHSDGHMNLNKKKNGSMFYFCNQNEDLIKRFCKLLLCKFECKYNIRKDNRDGTYYVYPQNIVARILANRIGWKTKNFKVPELILDEIPSYLRGLFDGDGTVYLYKNSRIIIPTIRISTELKETAINIKRLLKTINIFSRVCHETNKGNNWYNVVITRQQDFIRFVDKVGSFHPKKRKRMKKIKKVLVERIRFLQSKNSNT